MPKNISPLDIGSVYSVLKKEFALHRVPVVDLIELQTKDPFKVLVATILSARTKDDVTAAASRRLFSAIRNLDDLDVVSRLRLEKLIFPVGFYRTKAKHLKQLPAALHALFRGVIPSTIDELVQLPGVGRKTANLVVAVAFGKPAICVDVHVHRICNRLGYINTKTPFETEMKLRRILPRRMWLMINSYLVSFGQHRCLPVNPRCDSCPLVRYCNRIGVHTKFAPKSFL